MENPNVDSQLVSVVSNPSPNANPSQSSNPSPSPNPNPNPNPNLEECLSPKPNLEENLSTRHISTDSVKTGHVHAAASRKKSEFEREMELFEAAEREEEARLLASLRNPQEDKDGEINNPNYSSRPIIKKNNADKSKDLDEDYDYFGQSSDSGRIRTPVTRLSQQLKRKRVTRNSSSIDSSGSDYEEENEDKDEEYDNDRPRRSNQRKACDFVGWASKELVSFLQEIGEDPDKALSITAVKNIVLNYIETNELANPQRRAQVRCDEKLHALFQKKNVLKYELMKLLSPHVASKKRVGAKVPKPSDEDDEDDDIELDDSDDKQQKYQKSKKNIIKAKELKSETKEYAAIDVKNINLIYLKRSLLDYLREDPDFESKVLGTFVRIRVPAMTNKTEACYRLVQVVGVKNVQGAQNAKVGDMILEILNLQKREEITVDAVSTHDFTEEECQRLRQSVKCGLLNAMTVGQLEEKARALREAKVKDWYENEVVRLSHLRDRASEKGRKKELRECVEKLQVLSSPAQRERQLKAPIDINIDPHMNPEYESDDAHDLSPNNTGNQSDLDNSYNKKVREMVGPVETSHNVGNRGNLFEANHLSRISGQTIQKPFQKWVHESGRGGDNGALNTDNATAHRNHHKSFSRQDDAWEDGTEISHRQDERWRSNAGVYKKASCDRNISEQQYRMGIKNDQKLEDNQKDDSWRGRGTEAEGTRSNYYVDNKSNNEGNKRYDDWRFSQGRIDDGSINSAMSINDFGRNETARRDDNFDPKGDDWGRGRESDDKWSIGLFHETSNNRGITCRSNDVLRSNSVGNTNEWHGIGGHTINDYERKANTIGYVEPSDGWNGRNGGLPKREWTDFRHPYHAMLSGRTTDSHAHMVVEENAKIWNYHDPTGKIQGPFTMEQLRQWEKTKLFPEDLHVWRSTETPEDGILLTDLLQGNLRKEYIQLGFTENPRDFNNAPISSCWDNGMIRSNSQASYWAVEKTHLMPHDGGGSRQERGWGSSQGHSHNDIDKGNLDWERDSMERYHHHRPHRPDHRSNNDNGRFPTSKKDCPCRYFERGMCNKGQACEFKH